MIDGEDHAGHPSVGQLVAAGDPEYVCTATLIGERTLLTAEHCVCGSMSVVLDGVAYDVVSHTRYPVGAFGNSYAWSDVAILRLDESPPVEPIPLLSPSAAISVGTPLTVVGFGDGGSAGPAGSMRIGENQIAELSYHNLSYDESGGHTVGPGDSGGPSFAHIAGQEVQLGVNVSANLDFTRGSAIRTDFHAEWIRRVACGDVSFVDSGPSWLGCPDTCGNGSCDAAETVENCLADCVAHDTTPPAVEILLPEGTEVEADVSLPIRVHDNGVIEWIEYEVGEDGFPQRHISGPHFEQIPLELRASWFGSRDETITVRAQDVAGNVAEATTVLRVASKLDDGGASEESPELVGACQVGTRSDRSPLPPLLVLALGLAAVAFGRRQR